MLRVHRSPVGTLSFNDQYFVTTLQWPFAWRVRTEDLELLDPELGPEGTLGVRRTTGTVRHETWFDPARDFVCLRNDRFELRGDLWVAAWRDELSELVQLESGHWVATRMTRDVGHGPTVRRVHVLPLGPDDYPDGVFDGEALVREAREAGWVVESF